MASVASSSLSSGSPVPSLRHENLGSKLSFGDRRVQSAPPKIPDSGKGTLKKENPKRIRFSWRKLRQSVFGHAPYITNNVIDQMQHRPKLAFFLNIIYSILLAVSNTIFVSNPLCGLIILMTASYSAPQSVLLGLVSLLSGIFTSILFFHLPIELVRGGSITFNCYLLGTLIIPFGGGNVTAMEVVKLVPLSAALGLFVICIWCSMNSALSTINVPVLNTPCNLLALTLIFSGLLQQLIVKGPSPSSTNNGNGNSLHKIYPGAANIDNVTLLGIYNNNLQKENTINNMNLNLSMRISNVNMFDSNVKTNDKSKEHGMGMRLKRMVNCGAWDTETFNGICRGIVLTQGKIFQTQIGGSVIIYLSILLYSPILFFQELLGASIGTLLGVALCQQDCEEVFNGGWGYNVALSSAAVGGFFMAFNFQSWLLSIIASVFTAFLYLALKINGVPIVGIPFQVTMWLFIPIARSRVNKGIDTGDAEASCFDLDLVTDITTPENSMVKIKRTVRKITSTKYYRPQTSIHVI